MKPNEWRSDGSMRTRREYKRGRMPLATREKIRAKALLVSHTRCRRCHHLRKDHEPEVGCLKQVIRPLSPEREAAQRRLGARRWRFPQTRFCLCSRFKGKEVEKRVEAVRA